MLVDIDCLSKARGGGLLSPKSYVDVPAGPRKSDYLYTNFLPNFPPINIPFSKEKHPILTKLDAFYNIWPKIHPIFWIWAASSLMKPPPPPSLYQILRKGSPKGRHIYVYHVNVRTPGVTRPHFYANLTANNPMFSSVHTQWPPYPLLYQILHTNCQFSCTLHAFWEILQFGSNFSVKFVNFGLKLHFCTLNDSLFGEFTPKRPHIFGAHTNWPLFQRHLTLNAPYFCSPVGTCTLGHFHIQVLGWGEKYIIIHFHHVKVRLVHCHKIYRDEAVGLKSCKNTRKITIFVKMWNLGQYRENLIFCQ